MADWSEETGVRDMAALRRRIDALDEEIAARLVRRFACMKEAAHIKTSRETVYDAPRKREVLAHVAAVARAAGAEEEVVRALVDIYRNIIARSIAYEFACFDRRGDGDPAS